MSIYENNQFVPFGNGDIVAQAPGQCNEKLLIPRAIRREATGRSTFDRAGEIEYSLEPGSTALNPARCLSFV